MRFSVLFTAMTVVAVPVSAQLHLTPTAERCGPAPSSTPNAADWLRRAHAVTFPANADSLVLTFRAYHDVPLWEQSDRMYEPYIPSVVDRNMWYDARSGFIARQPVERPFSPGTYAAELYSATDAYVVRDTVATRFPQGDGRAGPLHTLNPWDVLRRWESRSSDVKVASLCDYRDQPRIVLALDTERLYLANDGTPVKLEREEAHYLFGQVRAEYVWTTWWGIRGGGRYPAGSFVRFDGETYHRFSISLGTARLVPRDSAPKFTLPATITSPPAGSKY